MFYLSHGNHQDRSDRSKMAAAINVSKQLMNQTYHLLHKPDFLQQAQNCSSTLYYIRPCISAKLHRGLTTFKPELGMPWDSTNVTAVHDRPLRILEHAQEAFFRQGVIPLRPPSQDVILVRLFTLLVFVRCVDLVLG